MCSDTTGQAELSELNTLSQQTLYRMWFILVISVSELLETCVVPHVPGATSSFYLQHHESRVLISVGVEK